MKDEKTRAVIDHYFELMGRGEDFATCYAADVQWTTLDGGTRVFGPTAVRDYLTRLHRNMPDIGTRPRAYADETAYVEGDCADPRSTSTDRIAFCVAYDVANGVITSARCYGAIGFLAPLVGMGTERDVATLNKGRSIGDEANLAQRIALEREKRNLSYDRLAKLMTDAGCAIQGSAIYKIEKANPPRRITVDELVALARVFELSVDDLLTPMDVLAQERARELLTKMDEGEQNFVASIAQLLDVYTEFLTLAKSAPELFNYVTGRRFSDTFGSWSMEMPEYPDYDFGPLLEASRAFFQRIIGESTRLVNLVGDDTVLHDAFDLDGQPKVSDVHG